MSSKKTENSVLEAGSDFLSTSELGSPEINKRSDLQVRVIRTQENIPGITMCKMPKPGMNLAFKIKMKEVDNEILIDGVIDAIPSIKE